MLAPDPIGTGLLLGFGGAAAWSDVRARRIPNLLTLPGTVLALAWRATQGRPEAVDGLLGAGVALGVGLVAYAAGVLGAGDGKLLMMTASVLGLSRLLPALLLTALLGGVLSVVSATRNGRLAVTLRRTGLLFLGVRPPASDSGEHPPPGTLPYGVPIALGSLGAWLLGGMG